MRTFIERTSIHRAARWPAAMLLTLGACTTSSPDALPVREFELVELARFDGAGTDAAALFGRIADLEIGDDGSVFVLDALNRTVHAFDTRGVLQRSFGGRGRGPGELEHPTALFRGPEGHLWVVDAGNARYTVFDESGAFVDSYPGSEPTVFHPLAVGSTPAGRVYTVVFEHGRLESPRAVLLESAVDAASVRLVRRTELPFASLPLPFEHHGDGAMLVVAVPFAPQPAFQIDAEGRLWHATTADPWVHLHGSDRGAARRYGRAFAAPPVTAAERQAALDEPDVAELRAAAGPSGVAALSARIPATKPHLRGFFVDDEANVWLMPTPLPGEDEAKPVIERFAANGELVGVARTGLEPEPRPRARGGLLAGVVRDDYGAETVVVYRVP